MGLRKEYSGARIMADDVW